MRHLVAQGGATTPYAAGSSWQGRARRRTVWQGRQEAAVADVASAVERGLGAAGVRITAADFRDRHGNEFLQNLDIEIRQPLEVQA